MISPRSARTSRRPPFGHCCCDGHVRQQDTGASACSVCLNYPHLAAFQCNFGLPHCARGKPDGINGRLVPALLGTPVARYVTIWCNSLTGSYVWFIQWWGSPELEGQ